MSTPGQKLAVGAPSLLKFKKVYMYVCVKIFLCIFDCLSAPKTLSNSVVVLLCSAHAKNAASENRSYFT